MQSYEFLQTRPEHALLLVPRVVELQIILKKSRLLRKCLRNTLRCPVILTCTIVESAKEGVE
jgi:hypothetical protein